MIHIAFRLTLALCLLVPLTGYADNRLPGPLADATWLKGLPTNHGITVIDIQEPDGFQRHHLEGAVNFPFSQWRTGNETNPPKSLPPLDVLADRLGKLGVTRETPVLIMALGTGPGDLSAAARAFWTLKILGHEQVSILDGGLAGFVNDHGGRFVSGAGASPTAVTYEAKPNMALLATADWIQSSKAPRLDARTLEERVGIIAGPGERPGTLQESVHLPYDWLAGEGGGKLRPLDDLKSLFKYAGLPNKGAVHFCHTGNRASLTWFVDYALMGNRDARLYDGSMIEWGKNKALPMETPIQLN